MMALNVLLTDIGRAFSQGRHVHITEQHLARVGVAHNGITIEAFKAIANRLNCNFYVGREDQGWLRGGGVESKEGEYGYVFCCGPCAEAGFSYQDYPKFIWSAKIGMAGLLGPVCGGPTPFQQWAKLNLGFYLHQADACESVLFDGKLVPAQGGIWLIKWEKESRQEIASTAEYGMWMTLQEWWNIMEKVQAMIPTRAR